MKNYSVTYLCVIALTALCSYLGLEVDRSSIETFVTVGAGIIFGLITLRERYKAGGITPLGVKK